jgi:hypothetical protein
MKESDAMNDLIQVTRENGIAIITNCCDQEVVIVCPPGPNGRTAVARSHRQEMKLRRRKHVAIKTG